MLLPAELSRTVSRPHDNRRQSGGHYDRLIVCWDHWLHGVLGTVSGGRRDRSLMRSADHGPDDRRLLWLIILTTSIPPRWSTGKFVSVRVWIPGAPATLTSGALVSKGTTR